MARSQEPRGSLRLLHVSQPTTAGVARVVAALAEYQTSAGHTVHVASPSDGTLCKDLAGTKAEWSEWDARRSPSVGTRSEISALARLVGRVEPDVVHLHSSKAGLAGRAAVRGSIPTIFQPHGWADLAVEGNYRRLARVWERAAQRWTDATICVSQEEATHARGLGAKSSVLIPNGVDLAKFVPRDRAKARARLGVNKDLRLVLCVGRLTRQKGQLELVEAWHGLKRHGVDGADIVLVLVGSGPLEEPLRQLGSGMNILFDTACEDPRDWYAASDLVIAPSLWEGAALVPLEAMAMARPVVGFDVGDLGAVLRRPEAVASPGDWRELLRAVSARIGDVQGSREEGLANLRRASLFDIERSLMGATDLATSTYAERYAKKGKVTRP